MDKDYKEKIRKLLALAESPNEHEARAALLKARQLMAEHKLTEAELKDVEKQQVKDVRTDITCSKRRDPWIVNLSAIIGENYCCKGYRYRRYGEQTNCIGFIGLEDDVEICVAVFKYAVDCALSEIKNIKKENACYYSDYVKRLCNSYGYGFAAGVSEAFRKQKMSRAGDWFWLCRKKSRRLRSIWDMSSSRAGRRNIYRAASITEVLRRGRSLTRQRD